MESWQLESIETLRPRLQRSLRGWADRADIEDAVQEALLVLLRAYTTSSPVFAPFPFAFAVARRHILMGRRRARRVQVSRDLDVPAAHQSPATNWSALLTDLGYAPSERRARTLELLGQGLRTTRGLARALDRDVASVKEHRARLQRWLLRVLAEWSVPPTRL